MAATLPDKRGANIRVTTNREFRVTAKWLQKVGKPSPQRRSAASRKLREAIQRETPVDTGRTRRTMTVRSFQQGSGVIFKIETAARYAVWIKHKKPLWPKPNLFMQRGYRAALPEMRRLLDPLDLPTAPQAVTIRQKYGALLQPTSSAILNKLLRRRQLDYGDAGAMRSRG